MLIFKEIFNTIYILIAFKINCFNNDMMYYDEIKTSNIITQFNI